VIPQQLGLLFSTRAAALVSYPTLQLLKLAKPISVMLCQLVLFRRRIDARRVVVVFLPCTSLGIFGLNRRIGSSSRLGVLYALFCDALYVPIVDQLKASGGPSVTMAFVFMWSTMLVGVLRFAELAEAFAWVAEHPEVMTKLALYGATGGIAGVALFAAIGLSDGLVVAIATTTRKFFTILTSAVIIKHNLRPMRWVGVVFAALAVELLFKARRAPVSLKT